MWKIVKKCIDGKSNYSMMKLICTNCLKNYGVRKTAEKYCIKDDSLCQNCGSMDGLLIDFEAAKRIQSDYIIDGTRVPYETPSPFVITDKKVEINLINPNVIVLVIFHIGICFMYAN